MDMGMANLSTCLHTIPPKPLMRFAIKAGNRIIFLDYDQVIAVCAEGNYALLQHPKGTYPVREGISDIAERLESHGFVRIHRSVLINARFVATILPRTTGQYELRMSTGQQFTVTRTYRTNLRSLAHCWIGTNSFAGSSSTRVG